MPAAVNFTVEGTGSWTGDVRVTGAVCTLDGVADTALVDSAQISLRGLAMVARRVALRVGKLSLTGEVDHDPQRRRHTRLVVNAVEASAAEVERLLLPSLRPDSGFLSRTLGRGAPLPDWLSQRRLDARIRVAALTAGDERLLEGLDARVAWDGGIVEFAPFTASVLHGAVAGGFRAVAGREPSYQGHFNFTNLVVREGHVDAEADWETVGAGSARLLAALQSRGKFTAKGSPLLDAEPAFETASGTFAATGLRLQFPSLQMTVAGEAWQGQGSAGPDGRLQFEVSASGVARPQRGGGRLW